MHKPLNVCKYLNSISSWNTTCSVDENICTTGPGLQVCFYLFRCLKASFQVYSMYSCQSLTLQQLLTMPFIYLSKSLHILSNMQLWWGKPPVSKMESMDSFSSEDCDISEYTFYNLNRATLLSCDFWGWARGDDDSLVYSTLTQMESLYFPRSCSYSASDE